LRRAQPEIPAPVEGYGKDDSPEFCADRLHTLLQEYDPPTKPPKGLKRSKPKQPYTFETVTGGKVILDHAACEKCETKICIDTCVPGILTLEEDVPVLNITFEEAKKGRCIECLACEVECFFEGNQGGYVHLPISGLVE
jgi:ferredoxin-like protein FixX